MVSQAEHEEVPKIEAAVETFGALKERLRDQHLAVRCCGQLKKWTQGNCGSQKKLAATCRGMTGHAGVVRRKGHSCQGPGKDSVVQGTQKERTFGRRYQAKLEGINCIRNQGARWHICPMMERTTDNGIRGRSRRQELCVGSVKTLHEALRQTVKLEVVK
jgi:hypothetical protein